MKAIATTAALLLLVTVTGCERYDRRDRPLPDLSMQALDGHEFRASELRGKPWVVNVWVPG